MIGTCRRFIAVAALAVLLALPHRAHAQDSDVIRFGRPPEDTVVLIFNHGTRRPQVAHDCNRARDIPAVIDDVAKANNWMLFYLCSHATDENEPGSYTYKRAAEIADMIGTFRAFGVPARHIFLIGQSAGGWSSLMVGRKAETTFNAVIALAPAFAGPRSEESEFPWWRREIFPKQMQFVREAKTLNALIFAFPDDPYDRPQELAPLAAIAGVTIVPFEGCYSGHLTAYTACFRSRARETIESYIRSRLP